MATLKAEQWKKEIAALADAEQLKFKTVAIYIAKAPITVQDIDIARGTLNQVIVFFLSLILTCNPLQCVAINSHASRELPNTSVLDLPRPTGATSPYSLQHLKQLGSSGAHPKGSISSNCASLYRAGETSRWSSPTSLECVE